MLLNDPKSFSSLQEDLLRIMIIGLASSSYEMRRWKVVQNQILRSLSMNSVAVIIQYTITTNKL